MAGHRTEDRPFGARARRRRQRRLLIPLAGAALIALIVGLVLGLGSGGQERALATRYVEAWSRGRYATMYALLDPASRRRTSAGAFAAALRGTADTATMESLRTIRTGALRGHTVPVLTGVRTRLFGPLRETLEVTLSGSGSDARVHLTAAMLFPGLRAAERLTRRAQLPPRASLLAADGATLAAGVQRSSTVPDVASAIAGALGPIPAAQAPALRALGYPPQAKVGLDGLERIFETRLAGLPAETLLAGSRVLASRRARAALPLRTTIVPAIERGLVAAMAGRYAGMVALDPRSGSVLGAAGVGFSGLQPPGSTMKMVTAAGVLAAGVAHLGDTFTVSTEATIDGFPLQNAGGEACGGTLLNAFAVSCNSVFAPLGVRLGAARFLAAAARFGFNQPSPIPTEPSSTIPPESVRGSALELGSSAIGQGKVLATTLEMADVGATIAMRGRRPIPTLLQGVPPRFVTVTTPAVAALVQRMMLAVVESPNGTGTAAQIPGVAVAGKTGTAELRDTANPNDPNASSPANTDAWFVGYAPAGDPAIVVAGLFPGQGAGGQTAAPAVRQVLEAALHR